MNNSTQISLSLSVSSCNTTSGVHAASSLGIVSAPTIPVTNGLDQQRTVIAKTGTDDSLNRMEDVIAGLGST